MFLRSYVSKRMMLSVCSVGLLASCMHKKYDTPITKNTQQPDKILFDQAMHDIEHGRYEVARISLNTLMNTYESSEYLAKAKLAIADSWFREGGPAGMGQAEAEYKDFILFYPNMEEAAEAQSRVCQIHYRQMAKSDRDWTQSIRAEDECRQLLVQFPNSKFAPQATQRLRNIQESLAEHEFVVGDFYFQRGANPAAANRLNAMVDQYPLFSKADQALYEAGESYGKMGPRFRPKAAEMYGRIVSDYPLSERVPAAKQDLKDMEVPAPPVDQAALRRAKYEQENYQRPGMMFRSTEWMRGSPDVTHAAKVGAPTMVDPKRTLPASIPVVNNSVDTEVAGSGGAGTGTTDVTASQGASGALDTNTDARSKTPTPARATEASKASQQPLPTNRDEDLKRMRVKQAKKQAQMAKKNRKHSRKGQDESSAPAAYNPQPASNTPQGPTVPDVTSAPNTPAVPTSPTPANTVPNPPQSR